MLDVGKVEKMQEPQIKDNFVLIRRDWLESTQKEAPIPKRRIDCFGDYGSCHDPTECEVRMNCIRQRIERIRRDVLGDRLARTLLSRDS